MHLSIFGRYRINEIELARHFGVGRMVARDVLVRLENLGLLEKDERQRWGRHPARRRPGIHRLYELRWRLEPIALRTSAGTCSASAPMPPRDPFMSEHRDVLAAVAERDLGRAESLLRRHLESSGPKVIERSNGFERATRCPRRPTRSAVDGPAGARPHTG